MLERNLDIHIILIIQCPVQIVYSLLYRNHVLYTLDSFAQICKRTIQLTRLHILINLNHFYL